MTTYINWEHADENGWVFEDGDSLPKNCVYKLPTTQIQKPLKEN